MDFDSNTRWKHHNKNYKISWLHAQKKHHNKNYKISWLHAQKILVLRELGSFKILEHLEVHFHLGNLGHFNATFTSNHKAYYKGRSGDPFQVQVMCVSFK
jgi:hypothetical protein